MHHPLLIYILAPPMRSKIHIVPHTMDWNDIIHLCFLRVKNSLLLHSNYFSALLSIMMCHQIDYDLWWPLPGYKIFRSGLSFLLLVALRDCLTCPKLHTLGLFPGGTWDQTPDCWLQKVRLPHLTMVLLVDLCEFTQMGFFCTCAGCSKDSRA